MIRSVCTGFVNSPLFRKRSPEAKLLWYALYLHQAQHMCGLFRLDLEHMALDAQLPLERTKEALAELIQHKLCQFDAAQDLVCVLEMTAQASKVVCPEWKGFAPMDRYIASLGASTLCKTVCDTLSIPYRYHIDTLLTDPDSGSVSDSGTGTVFTVGLTPPPHPVGLSGQSQPRQESQQGALIPEALASPKPAPERSAKPRKARAAKDAPETMARTNPVWEAYSAAFLQRHRTEPTRNMRVNIDLGRLIDRIGSADAPAVAAFYVRHPAAFYVGQLHPVWALLKDAEKLHAEWRRGQVQTMTEARQREQTSSNAAFRELERRRLARAAAAVPETVPLRVEDADADRGR